MISNCLRRRPTEKQFTCATYLCELRYGFKVVLEVGVLRSSYLVLDVTSMCSSAVAAICDALSITSLVARKLLGASFSLVRKCAGKPLLVEVEKWWRCGARRGRELETASCAKADGPRTRLRL